VRYSYHDRDFISAKRVIRRFESQSNRLCITGDANVLARISGFTVSSNNVLETWFFNHRIEQSLETRNAFLRNRLLSLQASKFLKRKRRCYVRSSYNLGQTREKGRDGRTPPNLYFKKPTTEWREKKKERREHTSVKKGQRTITPDHRCQVITSYHDKKSFWERSEKTFEITQQPKHQKT
jgi:hypothetical protein